MDGRLLFRLITPAKEVCTVRCDSIILCEKDNAEGQGGSLGIRPGHLPAVVALEEHSAVRAVSGEKTIFEAAVRGGFARVDAGSVTVLTPSAEIKG